MLIISEVVFMQNCDSHRQCIIIDFRKELSRIHQIKRTAKVIKLNKAQLKSVGIIFQDLEKAFDTL